MSDGAGPGKATRAMGLRLAAWLALAYLGYWGAVLIDRPLAPLLARAVHRADLLDVNVSALTIVVSASYKGSPFEMALFSALPFFASAVLWLALCWSGRRGARRNAPDATRHHPLLLALALWTGLWTVLQVSYQLAVFAWIGRGRFGLLFGTVAEDRSALSLRVRVTAVASLLLLAAGTMCARRLLRLWGMAFVVRPAAEEWFHKIFLAPLGVAAPVLFLLAAPFAENWGDGFGPRIVLRVVVPAAALLLFLLLAVLASRTEMDAARVTAMQAGNFSPSAVAVAVAAAVILAAGLSYADATRRWTLESRMQSVYSPHYEIRYVSAGEQQYLANLIDPKFTEARERMLGEQAARLNVSLQDVRLRLLIYSDADALRAATRDMRPYVVDGATIRALRSEESGGIDPAADAQALLYAAWGKAGSPAAARWVARWVAGSWRERPLDAWRARIESETGRRTLAELFDGGERNQISPLEREPLLADWVGVIASKHELTGVQKIYGSGTKATVAEIAKALGTNEAQLEAEWAGSAPAADAAGSLDGNSPRPLPADFFFAGISFSHESWQNGRGGYGSKQAAMQLEQIRKIGANAVALVPYGFVPSASDPLVRYTTTDESDFDLTEAAHGAHKLHMRVMLKPQLWVAFGKFSGELRFDDAAARARWMKSYREFILHYARLAELEGFDLLCIGTEMEGLTAHAQEWRQLIADIRRVYHGPLTYAAHFGQEFETLQFWDALDYIGLNNYYPLADGPATRAEQLLPRADALAAKLETISARWNKPILFTEAGYPSVSGGVAQPWIEGQGRPVSLEEQAAGYEAIFRAFTGRPWFRGMFWWKWPSNGEEGGPRDTSFSPVGKPAEEVVRRWFSQMQTSQSVEQPQDR